MRRLGRVLLGWFNPRGEMEVLAGYLERMDKIEREIEQIAGAVAVMRPYREERNARLQKDV